MLFFPIPQSFPPGGGPLLTTHHMWGVSISESFAVLDWFSPNNFSYPQFFASYPQPGMKNYLSIYLVEAYSGCNFYRRVASNKYILGLSYAS